jgi:haloalkane dehalogenase
MPGAADGARVLEALRRDDRPMLVLWGESDPVLPPDVGRRFAAALGAPEPELVPNASHFLQEDAGERVGERIARWVVEPSS